MPSYLYQEVPVAINPYQHPLELHQKALMLKDAKFKSGLSNLRNKYDTILNMQLTNSTNEKNLRSGVENVMNQLSKVATTDLSLPENQASVERMFDPIVNNEDILYDASWTSSFKRELDKAQTLEKTKPELVKPQNLHPLYKAQEDYKNGDPKLRPSFKKFTPFYDYEDKFTKTLDKVKQDVDNLIIRGKSLTLAGPDGRQWSIDNISQQQLKQIKDWKISQLLWEQINTDPAALSQMALDHQYNKDYGFYSSQSALADVKQKLEFLKHRNQWYRTAIDSGQVSGDEKEKFEKLIVSGNDSITDLIAIEDGIKQDPSEAGNYFTFNKFVKDYVESKVLQYSNREEGLLMDVPGYSKIVDAQLDIIKEQYKATTTAKTKALEDEKKKTEELALTRVPYIDFVEALAESPEGVQTTPDNVKALLNLDKQADGTLKYNLAFAKKGVGSMAILSPATGKLTNDQVETVTAATAFSAMKSELNNLGITTSRTVPLQGKEGDIIPGHTTTIVDRVGSEEILQNFSRNTYNKADNEKIKAVIDKYAPVLTKYGVDINDSKSIQALQSKMNDKSIDKAVTTGLQLNQLLTGRFTFTPDQDINVVQGQSGQVYASGYLDVSESELKAAGMNPSSLVKNDLARYGKVTPVVLEDNKQLRRGEQFYQVHVYVPVNGDVYDINDKMLDSQGYVSTSEFNVKYRENSRAKLKDYAGTVLAGYRTFNTEFNKITSESELGKEFTKMANRVANQTGKSFDEVYKGLIDEVKAQPNPIKRYNNYLKLQGNVSLLGVDTLPARLNNPLAITDKQVGSVKAVGVGGSDNLAQFATMQDGLQAGYLKFEKIYTGNSSTYSSNDSLESFNKKYTPRPGETEVSLTNLLSNLKQLGFTATKETQLNRIPLKTLFQAVMMKEDRTLYDALKSSNILDNFLASV